jgi:uncharacterized membrane protein YcaP (DUF421 family)
MEFLEFIFGAEGQTLNSMQMSVRAFLIFFIALFLLRLAGRRSLSGHAPYDTIILVTIGSILSRAIVGISPFIPTVAACFLLCLLHRILGMLMFYYSFIDSLFKGKSLMLYEKGKFYKENMKYGLVTEEHILEELRIKTGDDSLENYESISMEGSGRISVKKISKS